MKIKQLKWKYVGSAHCQWLGRLFGGEGTVCFFIHPTGRDPEEYEIRTDVNGIANECCMGLERAKARAQELLENYTKCFIQA